MLNQQTFFKIYEPKISIYDLYTSQWPFYCLISKCDVDLQLICTNVSNEQLCQNFLKSMHKCRSYDPDRQHEWPFYHWPSSVTLAFNLPKKVFQMALLLKINNCAKLCWNTCINVEVMARIKPERTTQAHTPNKICNSYVLLTVSRLDKKPGRMAPSVSR